MHQTENNCSLESLTHHMDNLFSVIGKALVVKNV